MPSCGFPLETTQGSKAGACHVSGTMNPCLDRSLLIHFVLPGGEGGGGGATDHMGQAQHSGFLGEMDNGTLRVLLIHRGLPCLKADVSHSEMKQG